jgi:hypothetical protein
MTGRRLTRATIGDLLVYDAGTGVFRWRISRPNRAAGSVAGVRGKVGYVYISVMKQRCLAHRLAWLLMTGEWPGAQIDHVNRDRADNRWANLRAADSAQNAWNSAIVRRATGVWRHQGLIYARIKHRGVTHRSGPFPTEAAATAWYHETGRRLRGDRHTITTTEDTE